MSPLKESLENVALSFIQSFFLPAGKRGSTVLKDLKLVSEKIGSLGLGN